jgi:membrane fusion protein (multidrug efflux system)
VDLDLAAREVERYRPLAQSGAEPAEKLAQLTATRDRAAAELAAREAGVTQAQRRVESIAAQGAQLAAHGDAARVAEGAASNDLAATRLAAPIAGRIASRSVRVGQFVQPGTRLLTVVPSGEAYVLANFKETQVGLMHPGQPAELRVDALPGVRFAGVVESITPGTGANFSLIPPQNATGNFTKIVQRVPVHIRILAGPVARAVLVPGLSVSATVDTSANAGEMDAIRAEAERAPK